MSNNIRAEMRLFARWLAVSALVVVTGCATTGPSTRWPESSLVGDRGAADQPAPPESSAGPNSATVSGMRRLDGPGALASTPRNAALGLRFSDSVKVEAAIDAMPVPALVHHVLGELLGANYMMAENVQAATESVTVNLQQAVSERRLFEIVQAALARQNILISGDEDLLYLHRETPDQRGELAIGVGRRASDLPAATGRVLQVVPLRYGVPESFLRIVRETIASQDVTVSVETARNVMFVIGSRSNVDGVLRLVRLLDVPSATGRYVGLQQLVYLDPDAFAEQVAELLRAEGLKAGVGAGEGQVRLVPIQRLGAVAVFAVDPVWLDRVEAWAGSLDIARAGAERDYFIYHPYNSNVRDLGDSLSAVLALGGDTSVADSAAGEDDASRPASRGSAAGAPGLSGSQPGRARGDGDAGADRVGVTGVMAVDERQNALIFYVTPTRYQRLLPMLEQLDRMPSQVVLEVTVAEITLDGRLEQGVEWFLRRSNYTLGTQGGLSIGDDGLSYALTLSGSGIQALFNLFEQQQRINILSSPRLVVQDGREATINVGDEVPIITSQATDVDAISDRVVQSVQYRSTGITLSVLPQVNARGLVSMQVDQEVSEAGENVLSGVQSPIILQRRINTEVLTGDGQSIILGGLIRENRSDTRAQVPLLGSIPLLGRLFRSDRESNTRTELIVVMTPRILRNVDDIDGLSGALRSGYRHLLPPGASPGQWPKFRSSLRFSTETSNP